MDLHAMDYTVLLSNSIPTYCFSIWKNVDSEPFEPSPFIAKEIDDDE